MSQNKFSKKGFKSNFGILDTEAKYTNAHGSEHTAAISQGNMSTINHDYMMTSQENLRYNKEKVDINELNSFLNL